MTIPMYTLLILAVVFANLPFATTRLFALKTLNGKKHIGHHLLELCIGFIFTGLLARLLESRSGNAHPQGWEFYATTVCLFLVAAFPGFSWRYFWQTRNQVSTHRTGHKVPH